MTIAWNKGLTKETDERVAKYAQTKLGHTVSKATRDKISKTKKGYIPWMTGKKHTEETKLKMSMAAMGREAWNKDIESGNHGNGFQKGMTPWNKGLKGYMLGSDNAMWKGGKTSLRKRIGTMYEYRQWRSDVFTRDDYTCQICGQRGGKLHAHHIKPFADIIEFNDVKSLEEARNCSELWNINNGITFCAICHIQKKHKKQNLENSEMQEKENYNGFNGDNNKLRLCP